SNARALWKKYRPKSNRLPDIGRPSTSALLRQVPAARTHQQRRGLVVERVGFSFGALVADGATDGVAQIDLPVDQVGPGRRVRVLEVGHEHVGAAVQRVDEHLAVDRAGDLDAP